MPPAIKCHPAPWGPLSTALTGQLCLPEPEPDTAWCKDLDALDYVLLGKKRKAAEKCLRNSFIQDSELPEAVTTATTSQFSWPGTALAIIAVAATVTTVAVLARRGRSWLSVQYEGLPNAAV